MCDKELLIGYLYGEVEPAERRGLESHLRSCEECRGELKELSVTRNTMSLWAPPEPELAFSIARGANRSPSRSWLASFSPAWGLAAAAVLVLAAASAIANVEVTYGADGLVVRTGWNRAATAAGHATREVATPVSATAPAEASREEAVLKASLEAVTRRVQELETASERPIAPPVVRAAAVQGPSGDLMRQMRRIVSESEERQQQELALRITQLLREFHGTRRQDAEAVQRSLARMQGMTDTTFIRQRDLENHVLRVGMQQK